MPQRTDLYAEYAKQIYAEYLPKKLNAEKKSVYLISQSETILSTRGAVLPMTDELDLKEHADTTHNDAMLGGMGIAGGLKFVDIMLVCNGDLATLLVPSRTIYLVISSYPLSSTRRHSNWQINYFPSLSHGVLWTPV